MSTVHPPALFNKMPEDGGGTHVDGQQQQQQQYSLPVLHQDAATITLMIDFEFFDANPTLCTKPADWDESSNLRVSSSMLFDTDCVYCGSFSLLS